MIEGLKPYPKIRDSGVPWLGDLPEHWDISPIRRIGQLFKGNGGSKEDEISAGLPCVRYGDLYTQHEFFIQSTKACIPIERASAYTPIEHGDLLFAASGETIEDIGRSSVNLLNGPACCGGDVLILRPSVPLDPRFLGYAADAPPARHQKARMGRGFTVVHIYASQLKRLTLPFPPLSEQAAIVRFLDHADRLIRRYIRAKKKLIVLLNEQKKAIIHQAVTRGLDPNVKFRPSGVVWLGDVPAHWSTRRLKQGITPVEQGWSPQCDAQPANDEEWGVLKVGCVNKESFDFSQNKRLPQTLSPDPDLEIRDGDILVSRANTRELLGLASLVENPRPKLILCDKLFRFRVRQDILDSRFIVYLLRARPSRVQIESSTNGASSSMQNIGQDVLRNLWVAVPPVDEQTKICAHIIEKTSDLSTVLDRASKEINLLQEYRTRLIADLITGKLDVREAAARLPYEATDEIESLDVEEEAPEEADGLDDPDLEEAAMEARA